VVIQAGGLGVEAFQLLCWPHDPAAAVATRPMAGRSWVVFILSSDCVLLREETNVGERIATRGNVRTKSVMGVEVGSRGEDEDEEMWSVDGGRRDESEWIYIRMKQQWEDG